MKKEYETLPVTLLTNQDKTVSQASYKIAYLLRISGRADPALFTGKYLFQSPYSDFTYLPALLTGRYTTTEAAWKPSFSKVPYWDVNGAQLCRPVIWSSTTKEFISIGLKENPSHFVIF